MCRPYALKTVSKSITCIHNNSILLTACLGANFDCTILVSQFTVMDMDNNIIESAPMALLISIVD